MFAIKQTYIQHILNNSQYNTDKILDEPQRSLLILATIMGYPINHSIVLDKTIPKPIVYSDHIILSTLKSYADNEFVINGDVANELSLSRLAWKKFDQLDSYDSDNFIHRNISVYLEQMESELNIESYLTFNLTNFIQNHTIKDENPDLIEEKTCSFKTENFTFDKIDFKKMEYKDDTITCSIYYSTKKMCEIIIDTSTESLAVEWNKSDRRNAFLGYMKDYLGAEQSESMSDDELLESFVFNVIKN